MYNFYHCIHNCNILLRYWINFWSHCSRWLFITVMHYYGSEYIETTHYALWLFITVMTIMVVNVPIIVQTVSPYVCIIISSEESSITIVLTFEMLAWGISSFFYFFCIYQCCFLKCGTYKRRGDGRVRRCCTSCKILLYLFF